jgi:hypothetical protein
MFKIIRITHKKSNLQKEINIYDYRVIDLNAITEFYENHKDFYVERI